MLGLTRYTWYWNLLYYMQPAVQYEVITKLPDDPEGNYRDDILTPQTFIIGFDKDGDTTDTIYAPPKRGDYDKGLHVKLPLFELGEILLVGRTGREIGGMQRKPSKWGVESERYWMRRKAIRRALEVIRESYSK